jgi:hypothetical protein
MTRNEYGKLYHITEERESELKIGKLLEYCSCKRGTITNSMRSNELYIISETNGFYYTRSKYIICRIEEQSDRTYKISNIEETDFENLFSLLALNNLLKQDVETVQMIINGYFEGVIETAEKNGIYYEMKFSENNVLSFLVEHGKDFYFYIEIDNGRWREHDVYIEMPEIDKLNIHSSDSKRYVKEYLLKAGMGLLEEYNIQKVKNGIIINDEYFESLEDGIFILEERKEKQKEYERKKKRLVDFFRIHDNSITTYSSDYKNSYVHKYDIENDKFFVNEKEVELDIMWSRLRDAGYEYSLY